MSISSDLHHRQSVPYGLTRTAEGDGAYEDLANMTVKEPIIPKKSKIQLGKLQERALKIRRAPYKNGAYASPLSVSLKLPTAASC